MWKHHFASQNPEKCPSENIEKHEANRSYQARVEKQQIRDFRGLSSGVGFNGFFQKKTSEKVKKTLKMGPQNRSKSCRKCLFPMSFEEVVFRRLWTHRTGSKAAGPRRFATVYMVIRKIRSSIYIHIYVYMYVCIYVYMYICIYVDSLLVALIFKVWFFRARFFRRGRIVLVVGRFGPPIWGPGRPLASNLGS